MISHAPLVAPEDQYNLKLVENVHPPGWRNPTPSGRYNLVVLGAGTAGLVSAAGAAILGARVAVVERHLMGGDCLNYGCVPSKALIRAGRAAYALREASEFGIETAHELADFSKVMQRVRRVRANISEHDSARRFADLGADVFLGNSRFVAPDVIEVDGQRLAFSKAIIATGGRPVIPFIPGLSETGFLTNETVFSLTELPRLLLVIGAGPIGCELAQSFARLGSEVTVISDGEQVLPREDRDAAEIICQRLEEDGVRFILGAKIQKASRVGAGKELVFDRGTGPETVKADTILVAVGRAPNIEDLNLDAAGVEFDQHGVKVNDNLRTSNPDIYAAGDVCSKYKFTHAAEAMAKIAIQNALFFGRKKVSSLVIPWCTYTEPEIAHVGLYESEARREGLDVDTHTIPLKDVDRAITDGDAEGFARVHVNRKTGKILGATLVSSHAGESIGEIVLAMVQGLKLSSLSGIIHPYPTQAEVIKHLGNEGVRSRFKPWMKSLLQRYFAWRR